MRPASLLFLVPLAACSISAGNPEGNGITPTGTGTSRSYQVSGFNKIDLAGSDNVDVRVGPSFAVTAEGPSEELDKLKIDKDGDTLEIGRKHMMSWGKHPPLTVHVTLPALAAANVSGSGDLRVDQVSGGNFAGQSAGSGTLRLGRLAVDAASFSIAGSGAVEAAGRAKSLDIDIAGAGRLRAQNLAASSAKVSITGSGDAYAAVDGNADISIMGSGDVDLGPKAHCQVNKMGSGSARCGA